MALGPRQDPGGEGEAMPIYEFLCRKCGAEFSLTMTMKEREAATIKCEKCSTPDVEPLLGPFFAKTSKKS